MKFKNTFLILLTTFFFGCEEGQIRLTCGPRPVISADFYVHAIDEAQTEVLSADIQDDCLFLSVSVTDICDIDDVAIELLDSGDVINPDFPERNLRVVSTLRRNCGVRETVVVSFDIRNLRVTGNQVRLNIQGYSGDVVYSY